MHLSWRGRHMFCRLCPSRRRLHCTALHCIGPHCIGHVRLFIDRPGSAKFNAAAICPGATPGSTAGCNAVAKAAAAISSLCKCVGLAHLCQKPRSRGGQKPRPRGDRPQFRQTTQRKPSGRHLRLRFTLGRGAFEQCPDRREFQPRTLLRRQRPRHGSAPVISSDWRPPRRCPCSAARRVRRPRPVSACASKCR